MTLIIKNLMKIINIFMLTVQPMNLEHEDVVCRLFPHTFQGKSSIWYFCLSTRPITSSNIFEDVFIRNLVMSKIKFIIFQVDDGEI